MNEEQLFLSKKDQTEETQAVEDEPIVYEEIAIFKQNDNSTSIINNIKKIKTRIRKDNRSKYVNAPSREIKEWFESPQI